MNSETSQLRSSISSFRVRLDEANATIRRMTDNNDKAAEVQSKRIIELSKEVDKTKDDRQRLQIELDHQKLISQEGGSSAD